MISQSFITYWSSKYLSSDYPEEFYIARLTILQKENIEDDIFKETIIALLHWKDKKANSYNPAELTAKENTLSVIPHLDDKELSDFKNQFINFRKNVHIFDKGKILWNWLTEEKTYWKSIVIPMFICHCCRPVEIPIIDQHVVRTMNLLKGNFRQICKTSIEWEVYEEYYDFYHNICTENSFSTFEQLRELDKALWAFGKNIKNYFCNKNNIDNKDDMLVDINLPITPTFEEESGFQKLRKLTNISYPHLDEVFAQRCYYYYSKGRAQKEAIKQACLDFNINFNSLPAMYSKYAGRGFNEWRNKGWIQ